MVIDYNFAHLHDGLTVISTERFWDELPSGLTRLVRSTLMIPDAAFLSGAPAGSLAGENVALVSETFFLDNHGKQIDLRILHQAGVRKDEEGNIIITEKGS
jgi:hypothetical protein